MARVTRRIFLGLGVAAAGGLAVGGWWAISPAGNPLAAEAGEAVFNPWLMIASTGEITIIAPRAEMGQGIRTTLAALVAEELDVGLDQVTVIPGPASAAYANETLLAGRGPLLTGAAPGAMAALRERAIAAGAKILSLQVTGGSTSTQDGYVKMREAGAAARLMLVRAAAAEWGLPEADLRTERAEVIAPSGARLGYGALALAAAEGPAPGAVTLKLREAWRILGKPTDRVDMVGKVTGAAEFGIDVRLPEMLFGTVVISPRFGAGPVAADLSAARAVPGVVEVVEIDHHLGRGYGVIAANTWAAFQGAEALAVEWGETTGPQDDAAMAAALTAGLDGEGFTAGEVGDAAAAIAAAPADEVMEVEYRAPFLAHACMEPMNATARYAAGRLELWTGTQGPGFAASAAGDAVGAAEVEVHQTLMGGGFGRRAEVDAAVYAALLARETHGRPVQVTWSREEDLRHDTYRPAAVGRFRAHVRPGEGPVAVEMKLAGPAVIASIMGRIFPALPAAGTDNPLLEGLHDQPYALGAARFEGVAVDLGVPVGFWRSVGHSQNGFFLDGLIDEMAHRAGLDPLALRLRLLAGEHAGPARGVLEAVAEMSGWGAAAAGRAKGVAFLRSYGTAVAMVAEVSGDAGAVRVERLWIAADPGLALDPRNFAAQLSGGAIMGLSAAIGEAVSFEGGAAREGNFGDYPLLTLAQAPAVEVRLLETAARLGGAGEPGLPPAAPALANAVFALTGTRLREMPFNRTVGFA